jgi:type VI protein secretion system component VasK
MLVGEARLGTTSSHEAPLWSRLLVYLLNAAIIIAGEVAALLAVGSGETPWLRVLVCGAVASGCAYLVMRFLVTVLDESSGHLSATAKSHQTRLVMLVSVTILAIIYFALVLGTA